MQETLESIESGHVFALLAFAVVTWTTIAVRILWSVEWLRLAHSKKDENGVYIWYAVREATKDIGEDSGETD